MPVGRRSTDHGSGEAIWVPMPIGTYMFEVGDGDVRLSSFKTQKGDDQYNVSFPLKLTDEEYERAKAEHGQLDESEELSGRTRYTCGLTLGWWKRNEYQTTRLADFLMTLLGSKQQRELRQYIMDGGGPYLDPGLTTEQEIEAWNVWFNWFAGTKVYGTVSHRADKLDPKKIWCDFGGPIALGQRPGPPDPDYEAFGRGKLRMILLQSNGTVEASDPEPEPVPAVAEEPRTNNQPPTPASQMTDEEKAAKYRELFGEDAPLPKELISA